MSTKEPIIAISSCTCKKIKSIGIIKISFGNKNKTYKKLIKNILNKKKLKNNKATYTNIYIKKKIIDNGIAIMFPEKKSYTGDKSLEIQTHGNNKILTKIINYCTKKFNIRKAKKGEFTLRAIKNNKINNKKIKRLIKIFEIKTSNKIANYTTTILKYIKKNYNNILINKEYKIFKKWNKNIKKYIYELNNYIKKTKLKTTIKIIGKNKKEKNIIKKTIKSNIYNCKNKKNKYKISTSKNKYNNSLINIIIRNNKQKTIKLNKYSKKINIINKSYKCKKKINNKIQMHIDTKIKITYKWLINNIKNTINKYNKQKNKRNIKKIINKILKLIKWEKKYKNKYIIFKINKINKYTNTIKNKFKTNTIKNIIPKLCIGK